MRRATEADVNEASCCSVELGTSVRRLGGNEYLAAATHQGRQVSCKCTMQGRTLRLERSGVVCTMTDR